MSTDFNGFGHRIAAIRKSWGYTQKEVYGLSNVSIETQRRIEHGLKEPKISTLDRLSFVYKVDLMKLLLNERQRTSYFSDEMIKFVNRMVWMRDKRIVKPEIDRYIRELRSYEASLTVVESLEAKTLNHFIDFLKVVRDIEPQDYRNKLRNIIEIEKLLLQFDRSKSTYLMDPYQFNIEVTFALFLVGIYNLNSQTHKSKEILDKLDIVARESLFNDLRWSDYKAAIMLNRMVVYQIEEAFDKMYGLAISVLDNQPLYGSNIMMNDFLFFKALAMYKLNIQGYEHLLQTLLIVESEERKQVILDEFSAYGYKITPPN